MMSSSKLFVLKEQVEELRVASLRGREPFAREVFVTPPRHLMDVNFELRAIFHNFVLTDPCPERAADMAATDFQPEAEQELNKDATEFANSQKKVKSSLRVNIKIRPKKKVLAVKKRHVASHYIRRRLSFKNSPKRTPTGQNAEEVVN